jgi:hypothetical protein
LNQPVGFFMCDLHLISFSVQVLEGALQLFSSIVQA